MRLVGQYGGDLFVADRDPPVATFLRAKAIGRLIEINAAPPSEDE
jgi:hypothetical protein